MSRSSFCGNLGLSTVSAVFFLLQVLIQSLPKKQSQVAATPPRPPRKPCLQGIIVHWFSVLRYGIDLLQCIKFYFSTANETLLQPKAVDCTFADVRVTSGAGEFG